MTDTEPDSFQGVLTVQAYNYYENFPQDPRRIKFIVSNSLAMLQFQIEHTQCLGCSSVVNGSCASRLDIQCRLPLLHQ